MIDHLNLILKKVSEEGKHLTSDEGFGEITRIQRLRKWKGLVVSRST